MTGYGRNGPKENAPAYDVNIQASCGMMEMTGTTQSGPIRTGAPILDYSTAVAAAFAISATLFERTKSGNRTFIDVSMLTTGLTLMSSSSLMAKREPVPAGDILGPNVVRLAAWEINAKKCIYGE